MIRRPSPFWAVAPQKENLMVLVCLFQKEVFCMESSKCTCETHSFGAVFPCSKKLVTQGVQVKVREYLHGQVDTMKERKGHARGNYQA
jgi:hypothetical protein